MERPAPRPVWRALRGHPLEYGRISSQPTLEALLLFLAVVTWASGSGAYYTAPCEVSIRMPSISPKKSYEGLPVAVGAIRSCTLGTTVVRLSAFMDRRRRTRHPPDPHRPGRRPV